MTNISQVLVLFSAHWVDSEWLSIHLHENIWSPAPDRDQTRRRGSQDHGILPMLWAHRASSGMHRTCRSPREKGSLKGLVTPIDMFDMNMYLILFNDYVCSFDCTHIYIYIYVLACVVQYDHTMYCNTIWFNVMSCTQVCAWIFTSCYNLVTIYMNSQ